MKTTELKIKRMSLAAEARLIRVEEAKALNRGRFQNALSNQAMTEKRLKKLGLTTPQVRRVLARWKNRANTTVYAAADAYGLYNRLRDHRIMDVRTAARAAHLAHHYLKGGSYSMIEGNAASAKAESLVDLRSNIARDVRTFGGDVFKACKPKDIRYWMEGGKTLEQEAAEEAVAAE